MTLPTGTKLGRYEIRSKIGAGGMGEVYLAQDTKLDRKVALKILPADVAANQDRMRRFSQEAKAAAALSHPNIAHVYEIDEADGQRFIAMEFVEGESLDRRLRSRSLQSSEISRIGAALADALAEAHAKGITHRDIKPSNIIVTPRGEPKVLDFGLARVVRDASETSDEASTQLKTLAGVIIGTVTYMSPEQAMGQPVDARSDIFSLGCVLYEMATRRPPFSGSTTTETIDRIIHEEPEAVSRFNYEVPQELERIIRKCLQKEKERRYQSARELHVDLKNLCDSGITRMALSTAAPQRARLSRWALVSLGLLLAALAVVVIHRYTRTTQPTPATVIDSIAVLPLANASSDNTMEYLSDGITESIINSLSQLSQLRVVPRVSVFRYKGREVDPQKIGRELGVRAVLTGKVVQLGDKLRIQIDLIDVERNSQLWGAQYDRQLVDILAVQDEIASAISNKLRIELSGDQQQQLVKRFTKNPDAYQLYLQARYYWKKYTKAEMEKSIGYFNQAIEKDPNYALAYSGLADAYVVLGVLYLPPKEVFPKAKAAAEKAIGLDESLAAGHISMGAYKLFYEWDWTGAQKEAQRAKELNAGYAKAIELNTNYDDEHHFYCQALDTMGQPHESIAEMQRALDLDPLSISMNMEMGWSLYIAREYDQAIARCRKTIELDPRFVPSYTCTAQAYEQKGMYAEAIADIKKALALTGDDPGVLTELGFAYALAGQKTEAQKLLNILRERSTREYIDASLIALIYIAMGDKDQAFIWLNKAYADRSSWMTWLKVEPKFDPLRSDQRFRDLMRRVGIT